METLVTAIKRKQQAQGPSPKPQFFRILLPGFLQRMTIPQTFSKYMVGEIQKKATLLSPLGKSWHVEVHRATNFFYFGEGWQEFSQAHGLNVGCLLVFGYEGEMVFTVTVFDQTACIKEYGPASGGNKMDGNFSSHVKLRPSESPRQQMCLQSMDSQNHNVNLARTCTEGSQFEINISSYNPHAESGLPLPQEFSWYATEDNSRLATILSPVGQPWHVKIHEDSKGFHFADGWQRFAVAHNLKRGDSLVFKHKGALIFNVAIFGNSICETEHNLDVVSGVANVKIPTEGKNSEKGIEKPPMILCGKRVAEATERTTGKHWSVEVEEVEAQNQKSEAPDVVNGSARRPHFEVVINLSKHHLKYTLGMPFNFIESNGLSRANWWFLRDPNGQLWPIRLRHASRSWSRIHAGWRDFCVGNNLQDGDVCLFEHKNKNELHVKIHRRRCLQFMSVLKDTSSSGKPKRSLRGQTAAVLVNSEMYHRAGQFTRINQDQKLSKISQFTSIISQSKLFGVACLNIPRAFLASVDLSCIRRIILLDPRGLQWPVNVYHREVKMKHIATIGCGWKAFCTSNNVEVGDKCIFKLASRVKNDVFHVSIIKQKAVACP